MEQLILIGEDDEINHRFLKRILEAANPNYKLEFAENGEMTINKLVASSPNCLILDIQMPRMDGFEVLEYLREHPLKRHPKILVMSGIMTDDRRENALRLRATDTILKPFIATEFLTKLDSILDKDL